MDIGCLGNFGTTVQTYPMSLVPFNSMVLLLIVLKESLPTANCNNKLLTIVKCYNYYLPVHKHH